MNLKGNVRNISIQYLYADSLSGKDNQDIELSRIDMEMFDGEHERLMFNKYGYLVQSKIFGEGKHTYKYAENSKGQIIEEFADFPCNIKKVYIYNNDKKLKSKTSYFEDSSWGKEKGAVYMRSDFSYEENMIVEKRYRADDNFLDLVIRKHLDDKGRVVKKTLLYTNFYGSGKREIVETFQYNRKDNLIKKVIKDSIGVISREETYDYIIDERGNWNRKEIYWNGKKKYVAVRTINYFKPDKLK